MKKIGLFGNKTKKEEKIEQKTYDYEAECEKCDEFTDATISFGTPVKEFFKGRKCENCGCSFIKESETK